MAVIDSELLVIGFIDRPDANDIEGEEPEFLIFNSETASRRVTGDALPDSNPCCGWALICIFQTMTSRQTPAPLANQKIIF